MTVQHQPALPIHEPVALCVNTLLLKYGLHVMRGLESESLRLVRNPIQSVT